jgi:nitrogen fixation/metabolism regulation signal transduction histidine kinase
MKRNLYAIQVIVRILLISMNCFLLIWVYKYTDRPTTTLFLLFILIFQTISLIRYHNEILRDLSNFLVFLHENDTTLTFSREKIEKSFKGLIHQFDSINKELQTARIEKERQFHYLQAVIRQIDTGIIAFDQEGRMELFNHAAEKLLGIRAVDHREALQAMAPALHDLLLAGVASSSTPLKIMVNGQAHVLAVKSTTLKFANKEVSLISFQNIRPEMEAGELDAWRKLIRIQRHEIINSMTPITTLTTAIRRRLKRGAEIKRLAEITEEQLDGVLESVDVIEERSRGLIDFVERFQRLTDVPVMRREAFRWQEIIEPLMLLFSGTLHDGNITVKVRTEPSGLVVRADKKLMEQVMINLVKNAIEGMGPQGGEITVRAFRNQYHQTVVQVTDNGTGIEKYTMESIFVPSFTTKPNGSGIGLSIARQIIMLHGGTISARSEPGVETVFEIVLPG